MLSRAYVPNFLINYREVPACPIYICRSRRPLKLDKPDQTTMRKGKLSEIKMYLLKLGLSVQDSCSLGGSFQDYFDACTQSPPA